MSPDSPLYGLALSRFDGEVWFDRFATSPGGNGSLALPQRMEQSAVAYSAGRNGTSLLFRVRNMLTRAFGHARADHPPISLSFRAPILQLSADTSQRYSLYTPELNLMAETEQTTAATPAIAYEYVWFGGQPVAQFDAATNTPHWTFTDHLGTPILQTNASGTVDWRAEYEPYGIVNTLRAGAARHQPLRFPGQEYDEASADRSYNIFRWYRGGWGRYTQGDPKSLRGDINLYRYTRNNPIIFLDPLGLQLYVTGPKPVDDPFHPPSRDCNYGAWQYDSLKTTNKGSKHIWKNIGETALALPIAKGQDALSSGWCLCEYELAGSMHFYETSEEWSRKSTCCGEKRIEKRFANFHQQQVREPSIFAPGTTMWIKKPMNNGDCDCNDTVIQ